MKKKHEKAVKLGSLAAAPTWEDRGCLGAPSPWIR
jgi:hypothetical protein